ncbi:MAG: metalloregulator ArsR/SmtB family transcription factor [Streptosporangiales bacterium]|nr:metalloregulator ArsR/SmtB family transcription factor [Streptosporangiales bacterium]
MSQLLADPLRAQIVGMLADGALCTCHLVDETGAKQPTISHHLRVLREAGLITAEPAGRFTYYRLRPDALDNAATELADLARRARRNAGLRRACP